MDVKTIDLFDSVILRKHNIIQNSEEWKELARRQRLMRLNIADDTTTYLMDKGLHSANHIAAMPLSQFLELCQDFPDNKQLEDAHKAAQAIRSTTMHMMANMKNLHPSGHFASTKAFTADPELSASFKGSPSYESLFGSLDYYECSEFSSIFGPAAYLLDLMRITQIYISDTNAKTIPSGLHFFDRRPDIKELVLTENNVTTEVLKLKIVNERIDALLKKLIPEAKKDYVAWLDQAVYPFSLPFCLPLTQIRSGLDQVELDLLAIYKTLQADEKYCFRELLTLSPEQYKLITTEDVKRQTTLWDEDSLAKMQLCALFSKKADFDAKDLIDLFQQNLDLDKEKESAKNFYIGKHLAKHKAVTEHYLYIKKDSKGDFIQNLNVDSDKTVVADNLDMIGRFIRFSQYIGFSFQEADWLLNVAEFLLTGIAPYDSGANSNRIDALCGDHLTAVSKIYQLADLLEQPVVNILDGLGIVKTYGVGIGVASEAPFDIIFNGANEVPYHPSYAGNPTYKDTVQTWDLSNKEIPLSVINILSQLGLGKTELLALGKYALKVLSISNKSLPLSVENLSLLYSYSSIANWLHINIVEFVLINENLNKIQIQAQGWSNPIDDLISLVNTAMWMKKHNTNVFKVDYIINGNMSRYVDLGFSIKDFPQWLKSTRALTPLEVGKVTDETVSKLIDIIANYLNVSQEIMQALFRMNSTDWVLDFLTTDSLKDAQLPIIRFSRLLALNNFLQINTPVLLSSVNQHPESYGFKKFPASSIKVGINLTQLQNLTAFRGLQEQFNDTQNDFIRYIDKQSFMPNFNQGKGYTITNVNTITNTSKVESWSQSIAFSSDIVKNGKVSFKMGQGNTQVMFGLAVTFASTFYSTINYAIFANQGLIFVVEKGKNKMPAFGSYTTDDVLSVERYGNTVGYYKNGVLFYTSTIKETKDMYLCVTFADVGGFITNVSQSDYCLSERDGILHHLTNWDIDQVQAISSRYTKYNKDIVALIVLVNDIFSLTKHLGDDVNMLFSLADKTTTDKHANMQAASELLFAQLKSCYTTDNFQVTAQIISGKVLEKKRDVIVGAATWALRKTYTDIQSTNNLSEYLLTDVSVSAKIKTSYIKEAISAAQLYLQRVKLDVEQFIVHMEIKDIWWQWISNYRIWEANREVYLYPENYLEPSLRKNQSTLFQDFSQTILKNNITPEATQKAFEKYFQGFEQLADMKYLSSYYTEDKNQALYYFFAVSATHPPQYYYCTYSHPLNSHFDFESTGMWSSWNKIDVAIKGKNITPIYHAGKLMILWVEVEKSSTSDVSSPSSKKGGSNSGGVATNRLDVYKAKIEYIVLQGNNSWGSAQTLIPEEIVYVDDQQGIGLNKLETGILFNGVFDDMDSDEWNTVYATNVGNDIAVYYGPFLAQFNDKWGEPFKNGLKTESIEELSIFELRLYKSMVLYASMQNSEQGWIEIDDAMMNLPYIDVRVFNQELMPTEVKLAKGYVATSSFWLSSFLDGDLRFLMSGNDNMLYANLASNIYDNYQFGNTLPLGEFQTSKKFTILNFEILASELPDGMSIAQLIDKLKGQGWLELMRSVSYCATVKYPAISQKQKTRLAQLTKILNLKSGEHQKFLLSVDNFLMTGINNRVLLLFNGIYSKYSKQFSVKNKSGTFLYKNKNNALFLDLQAKNTSQSSIISPSLHFGTPKISVRSFYFPKTSEMTLLISKRIFAAFLADGFIKLASDKSDYGFVDIEKFTKVMKVNNWEWMDTYLNKKRIDVLGENSLEVLCVMLASPKVSSAFFVNPLVNLSQSEAIYQAFIEKGERIISIRHSLCRQKIIDMGIAGVRGILIRNKIFISEQALYSIFDRTINCNSLIAIFNTPYSQPLSKVKYSIDDCGDLNCNVMRLDTNAFVRLKKQLMTEGIGKTLSLNNQQIPITTGNWISDLQPAKNLKLPSLLNGDQVDFVRGPYAQYYWELFFHAPILVVKNLSNQNKFEEAINWLRHIFNPSKKRKHITEKTFSTEAPEQINATTSAAAFKLLQETKLDENPYIDSNGDVNKNYKGNEKLDFLKLSVVQTRIIRSILSNYHIVNPINSYWNFEPFRNHTLQTLKDMLTNKASIQRYEDNPFDPFAIAQLRIGAFEKYVLMLYIDILIQWGDSLFTIDTRESINEATMLYLYAYDMLGSKPENLGRKHSQNPASFATILAKYGKSSAIPEFLIDMENHFHFKNLPATKMVNYPFNDLPSYFCIPENKHLIARWDTIEDRLQKIHNSLDIKGNFQELALFAPPINPMDLVRATASGGNALSANSQNGKTVPIYRFASIVQLTKQCIDSVVSLGRLLEGDLEKYEAEDLSLLHTTQEGVMLNLINNLKQDNIEQEENVLGGLNSNLKSAIDKKRYYDGLIKTGISSYEETAQVLEDVSIGFGIASGISFAAASYAFGLPQYGSPFALTYGGVQLGGKLSAIGQTFSLGASISTFASQRALTDGSYDRRNQEWVFSSDQAGDQIEEINNQMLASRVRIKMTQQELENNKTQIQQNQVVADYLHHKFTNKELYQWLAGRISALYYQQYQLALKTATLAQKSYQFELNSEQEFINIVYWDTTHKGLLAGESLLGSLTTMEQSYKTYLKNRKLEIEKTISLKEFNPAALKDFKKGKCTFELTERLFDNDFPGHYQRQVKSISISVPMIIGPYENLHATLLQLHSAVVLQPDIEAVKYLLKQDGSKKNIRNDWRNNQKIAISRGIEDAGVFQLDFRDEMYLPFENTGAVSTWVLSMPVSDNKGIDYTSISDVIINLRYSAIAGSPAFTKAVREALKQGATYPAALCYDLKQSFLSNWHTFMQDHSDLSKQQLEFSFNFNVKGLRYFDFVSLDKVVVRITTSAGINIEKSDILSLSIRDKVTKVDINNKILTDNGEYAEIKGWREGEIDNVKDSESVDTGWATDLDLKGIDAINANWVLSFDLNAIAKDDNLKAILKDGFIDPDKLLKIEVLSLYFGRPTK
ncbi:hypothetical protein MS2017_0773 [Bathymodiolus thermophilus thioautotrophic gill symbiont]|uniref:Uncharacterized protein n=1 Tax=Bathymodiolus thermophilus thioautotrophic gill symbiont TaxID=2360 RepID=A0A3G3IL45_9GAMM|nr:neuraminidase-like domain-containing protein [Bathymodiolus thermophilus thioautotrophic gill symbiont]AYQ56501.1 hypothetical protein MS2017_0773 [Bathymodiolus thermophilus thioautotrophic gill symbiont]